MDQIKITTTIQEMIYFIFQFSDSKIQILLFVLFILN